MVILHIASIDNSLFAGVCVAVPQHLNAQAKYATIGFLNVNNIEIESINCQLDYEKRFDIKRLPKPFNKPDLVVFHEAYRVQYLSISGNLRKNKIPYIVIPHGELRKEAQKKKWLKKKVANFLLFNWFISHAAAVQCLSQLELEATPFGKEKFVGTNGIKIPSRRKMTFRTEGGRFVYIGRLESKVKGLDLMLEAVRLKADFLRQNRCQLHMYGPDYAGSSDMLQNMIREKGIEDIVRLKPAVSGQEKEDILLDGDVFIQTSRHEGMPMGILEALSYGIPCLITRGTNLGETVESVDAGWMAEDNAESISQLLEKSVLDQDGWQWMGHNAAALVEQSYAWEVIAADTVSTYQRFVE